MDIDLENFFDTVAHDKLMALLAKEIKDKVLLKLMRKFLQAGVMHNGVVYAKGKVLPRAVRFRLYSLTLCFMNWIRNWTREGMLSVDMPMTVTFTCSQKQQDAEFSNPSLTLSIND